MADNVLSEREFIKVTAAEGWPTFTAYRLYLRAGGELPEDEFGQRYERVKARLLK